MRAMVVVALVAAAFAVGLILYLRSDSGVTGQSDIERPGPTGPAPDLTGYQAPPGCVLDSILERDGWVWSEFLDAPLRPVVRAQDDGETDTFPVEYYPEALNCSVEAEALNPYTTVEGAKECEPEPLRSRDGWIEGECEGRVRPDIPVIGGDNGEYVIQAPIGPDGIIFVR